MAYGGGGRNAGGGQMGSGQAAGMGSRGNSYGGGAGRGNTGGSGAGRGNTSGSSAGRGNSSGHQATTSNVGAGGNRPAPTPTPTPTPTAPTYAKNAYGIGDYKGSDREAEYTLRDIYRAQWEDYKSRYQQHQQTLVDKVTSREMLDEQLSRITATTRRSNRIATTTADMARERYGMQVSGQQSQSNNLNMQINGALGLANAQNNARTAHEDRYQLAMTGSAARPDQFIGSTGGATS